MVIADATRALALIAQAVIVKIEIARCPFMAMK
jgi:hypothetical protein